MSSKPVEVSGEILALDENDIDKEIVHKFTTTPAPINIYRIFIDTLISTDEKWYYKTINILRDATVNDIIELHLNTPGGSIYTGLNIIDAVNISKAKVNLHISGLCASCGTLIFAGGKYNEIMINDHTTFLFHSVWSGTFGKVHEMKDVVQNTEEQMKLMFEEIYKDILTRDELDEIYKGRELYLLGRDVKERLENRELKRQRKDAKKK